MNRLSAADRTAVIAALTEGVGINATCRLTGVSKNTVLKLLAEVAEACDAYQDKVMRNLKCKRIQCDEIWSFCYAKSKNASPENIEVLGHGDVWTWTALDADTKLIPTWYVGGRTTDDAMGFMRDLAPRLANKVQLTTDGHKPYLEAVEDAFGGDVDYAMLIKHYAADRPGEARYSPPVCTGCKKKVISGEPDIRHVSTSYTERQNLSMRMGMRRFTRLTNGFSKKLQNHEHAIALYFMHYNFVKVHKTIRVTPAMAAGVTDRLWEIEDIIALADQRPSYAR